MLLNFSTIEKAMSRCRVLVAEDHVAVATQLHRLLAADVDVVAMVRDGYALLGAANTLWPDVIVADIALPGVDGIAASQKIIEANPDARIVLVTVDDNPALLTRGLEVGVMGYVMKLMAGEELLTAVLSAWRGERYISRMLRSPSDST